MMIAGVLPTTLFQPLAAPGATVYTRILLDIFIQTQSRPDPLSRELMLSLIYKHIAEPQAFSLTQDAQADNEPSGDGADPVAVRAADCAGLIDALLAAGQKLELEAVEPRAILHGMQLNH